MLTKCANPECSASFRYLHEGRLFLFETEDDAASSAPSQAGSHVARRLHHFWLCSDCSRTMTMMVQKGRCEVVQSIFLRGGDGEGTVQPPTKLANRESYYEGQENLGRKRVFPRAS